VTNVINLPTKTAMINPEQLAAQIKAILNSAETPIPLVISLGILRIVEFELVDAAAEK